ncbi:dihydrodipicolinate synthase family protein [Oceanidesulfovibrio marinus]|uniref:Dihydrodipicolinate synthase family protein n=1 Tax=Oceanidesulfovibrio marinus TaxID=370038 RepID=A0ABX6NAF6_9BACT|nr:dihydrodipicolinate synthase family protein [Oceanidesulfovibrio marinus]QJT07563.1 dihydrodipicolinate synthase family protein [Oceanidesulfovibrio marinus]
MFRPEGVYPALLTPFSADLRVNEAELRKLVEFCIGKGVHGIFPVSSVGEGLHMDHDEKCRCMDIVVDQVAGRIPVTPGVVGSYPQECIRLAKHAASLGCAAVVVTPPYYFKPSPSMVQRFFETIGEESGIPLILYNIPLFTQPLDYATAASLSTKDYVVGMKDSSGSMVDFLHFTDAIQRAGGEVQMLTGREENLIPSLLMGAKGCITASSGIFPEIMVGAYDAWMDGNVEEAKALQREILILVRTMFAAPFPVGFKLALELRGFEMGPPLLPLGTTDEEKLESVKQELKPLMEKALKRFEGVSA